MSQENQTLAAVLFGFVGNTLFTLGTGFNCVGTLYAVYDISGSGIGVLEKMPLLLEYRELSEEESKQVVMSRGQILKIAARWVKIVGVVVGGTGIKFLGKKMLEKHTIGVINKFLY